MQAGGVTLHSWGGPQKISICETVQTRSVCNGRGSISAMPGAVLFPTAATHGRNTAHRGQRLSIADKMFLCPPVQFALYAHTT